MKMHNNLILTILVTLLLSACGGGSGGGSSDNRDTGNTGTASLSWIAPSTRTDNSYLSPIELQGYRIYYGTSADDLSMLVDLNDSDITEYTITSLPSGSYFFGITAYDADGTESEFSNILSKDV